MTRSGAVEGKRTSSRPPKLTFREHRPPSFSPVLTVLAGSQSSSPTNVQARADRLTQRHVLVDGHVDLPHRLNDFFEEPAGSTIGGDFDYPRARAGGVNAPFMSIYVPTSLQETPGAPKRRADTLIDLVERIAAENSNRFRLTSSPSEVRQIAESDLLALPMGMENGAALEKDLENLQHFYDRGIRYITLTHGEHNQIGDSSYDDAIPRWNGLSPFGERVVEEMNRLGIMVDVSHVTDATARDVLTQTKAPVIASHSSCRHFTPAWERNVSDDLIRGIAESGGIVMITFGSTFLRAEYQDQDEPIEAKVEAHIEAMGWPRHSREAVAYEQRMREAHPIGTVADVADHIDHVVTLVGVEHVGLGSDFDGVFALPDGLQDASDYPNLVAELLRRNYTEEDLRKILGENVLRVWGTVERAATTAS